MGHATGLSTLVTVEVTSTTCQGMAVPAIPNVSQLLSPSSSHLPTLVRAYRRSISAVRSSVTVEGVFPERDGCHDIQHAEA